MFVYWFTSIKMSEEHLPMEAEEVLDSSDSDSNDSNEENDSQEAVKTTIINVVPLL